MFMAFYIFFARIFAALGFCEGQGIGALPFLGILKPIQPGRKPNHVEGTVPRIPQRIIPSKEPLFLMF